MGEDGEILGSVGQKKIDCLGPRTSWPHLIVASASYYKHLPVRAHVPVPQISISNAYKMTGVGRRRYIPRRRGVWPLKVLGYNLRAGRSSPGRGVGSARVSTCKQKKTYSVEGPINMSRPTASQWPGVRAAGSENGRQPDTVS